MTENDLYSFCGTPLNMAPEILLDEPYDLRADVWSIGVAIFEIIVGKKPFNAISSTELKLNLNNGVYKIPKKTTASLICIDFMNQCLQFKKNSRSSINELSCHPFVQ